MTTRYVSVLPMAIFAGLTAFASPMAHAQEDAAATKRAGQPMTMRGTGKLSAMDKKFMMEAAKGGMAEVQLGQLATKKGVKAGVKQFGAQMVEDHTSANEELKGIAASKGVTLPTDVGAKYKAIIARLSKLNGAALDSSYIKNMVMDHEKDIKDFTKASKNCNDPDVKSFAAKTLPTLKGHYTMIKEMRNGKMASKMPKM